MLFTAALAYKIAFGINAFFKVIGPIKRVELIVGVSIVFDVVPAQQSAVIAVNL